MSLQNFKKNLQEEIYGKESHVNREKGLCIQCKEPAIPNCYSQAGKDEFKISGLCEKCFDKITGA